MKLDLIDHASIGSENDEGIDTVWLELQGDFVTTFEDYLGTWETTTIRLQITPNIATDLLKELEQYVRST